MSGSRRSKSRDRGRSQYRGGDFEEVSLQNDREHIAPPADKRFIRVCDFVKRQFKNYGESHDMDIVAKEWDVSKATDNLEIAFQIKNIPDCTVFCKEMEALLESRKPILEIDNGEYVLKISYTDLQRASGRAVRLWTCFGMKNRIVRFTRNFLVGAGLAFFLWMIWYFIS